MNRTLVIVTALSLGASAGAQSLFRTAPEAVAVGGRADPAMELEGVSLYAVRPPEPREFKVHDLVTIIVNQSSKIEHDQSLETEKDVRNNAGIDAFPDFRGLLEFTLNGGSTEDTPELDVFGRRNFEGDGEFQREDRITARITAEVIDVKPNGLLVLEARTTIVTDKEEQTMVISGTCRSEDVSDFNTVQSTSLADLRLFTQNTGELRQATEKGFLTKVLEAFFAF